VREAWAIIILLGSRLGSFVDLINYPDSGRMCQSITQFYNNSHRDNVRKWTAYFAEVLRIQQSKVSVIADEEKTRASMAALLWEAHTSGLVYGLEVFTPELMAQSRAEAEFDVGFCRAVIGLESNYVMTTHPKGIRKIQRTLFPYRVLTRMDDDSETISEFSDLTNQFISRSRKAGRASMNPKAKL
jgi:hypothetical protein